MPRRSGWAIPDDGLDILAEMIGRLPQKALVVELGSGRSTVALAAALEHNGGRLVSLDHLDEHRLIAQDALDANGFTWAEVRFAPIDESTHWYGRDSWDDIHPIDMLVVDGPPGHLCPHARQPALPALKDRLTHGCAVVLDDFNRPDEQLAWRMWQQIGLSEPTVIVHSGGALAHGVFA